MDRTPSSFVRYFLQKSSRTQRTCPAIAQHEEGRCQRGAGGLSHGMMRCWLRRALSEASRGSFPAAGPQVASPGPHSAPQEVYHLRTARSHALWILVSPGGLLSLQVQLPATGLHLPSCH